MKIKEISYKEIAKVDSKYSLLSTSEFFVCFCREYWLARPIFLGFFDNQDILCAYLVLFIWEDNGLKYIGASLRTYTEIIYLQPINITVQEIKSFLEDKYKFDVMDFSFCSILNSDDTPKLQVREFKTAALILSLEKNINLDFLKTRILDKKTRNQIKKTENFDLKIVSNNDIESFYLLYCETMTRLKAKPKGKMYFSDLKKCFGDNFFILSVEFSGKVVGANLFLITGDYLSLLFNVSLKDYWKYYINDFLYWEMIKFGLEKDALKFDFGINAKRDHAQIHFKEGFGAKPYPIFHKLFFGSWKGRIKLFYRNFIFLIKLVEIKIFK